MNSMRNMNMEIPHLHSLHLALLTEIYFYDVYFLHCIVRHHMTIKGEPSSPQIQKEKKKKSIKWSVRNKLRINSATEYHNALLLFRK